MQNYKKKIQYRRALKLQYYSFDEWGLSQAEQSNDFFSSDSEKHISLSRKITMHIVSSIGALGKIIGNYRQKGKSIGFVPTMGALHRGHISLLKTCLATDDVGVVSIYVNPTQFNDTNDLKKYPRNFDADSNLLSTAGCHVLFAPEDCEIERLRR